MTQSQITEYFEDLAKRFIPISHDPQGIKRFSVIDSDTISEEIRHDLNFNNWCMLLEEAAPRIESNETKAFNEYYTFRFTVCKDISRLNFTQKRQTKEDSLQLSKQIFAHIIESYKGSKLFNAVNPFALKNIQFKANFEYYEDILNENLLGTDCLITIYGSFNAKIYNNQTLWN